MIECLLIKDAYSIIDKLSFLVQTKADLNRKSIEICKWLIRILETRMFLNKLIYIVILHFLNVIFC